MTVDAHLPTPPYPLGVEKPPRAIIFDLGDVLFQWSSKTTTTIHPKKLRAILSTPIWNSYERGEITREECFDRSGQYFSLPPSEIAEAFVQARASLQPDLEIVEFLRELKRDPSIEVYAMSNIGKEDYEDVLASRKDGDPMWLPGLFDRVFTSAGAGMRKPERGFYKSILEQIGRPGDQVVFVDDKQENVRAARGLGIQGIVFRNGHETVELLRSILETPVAKAWKYLYRNANTCHSITDNGVCFEDNFAKLLIGDILQDRCLIDLNWGSRETWNFFGGLHALIPGGEFPDDLDTTSLALQVVPPPCTDRISMLLDRMSKYVNDDGSFMTYFTRSKPRSDPIVNTNILTCFYAHSRGHQFPRTLELVHSLLLDRSYLPSGTHYYSSPDICLFFVGRLLKVAPHDPQLQGMLAPLFKARVQERLECNCDATKGGSSALDVAARIITAAQTGIPDRELEDQRQALMSMQCDDGSWAPGWMYQYGSTGVKIGNRAMTTALAVQALQTRCGHGRN